jgi:26 proteasome complex subunit DSS1
MSSADKAEKSVLELLEEDDEFEEFEAGGGGDDAGVMVDEEGQLFQDTWDDDDTQDDFTEQLRAQLETTASLTNNNS